MKSYRKVLDINCPKRRGYINITPEVQKCLEESGIKKLFLKKLFKRAKCIKVIKSIFDKFGSTVEIETDKNIIQINKMTNDIKKIKTVTDFVNNNFK